MNAHDYAVSVPWAITEAAFRGLLSASERIEMTPDQASAMHLQAVRASAGERMKGTRRVDLRDGVAILPVRGPIFRYASLFSSISGATSYQVLAEDFRAALDDPEVTSIVLEVDSPGGMVSGCGEFADMIYAARGIKPIEAYVSGLGCSAAYWIASAADRVVVSPTAIVGSIGVIGAAPSRAPRQSGEPIQFVSSQSPNKVPDPETRSGRGQIESEIDALAALFVADVARNRGVTEATVLADFGGGGCFVGKAAVAAGLADAVGSFEGLLSTMAVGVVPGRSFRSQAAAPGASETEGSPPMFSLWKKKNGALALQSAAVDEGDVLATTIPISAPAPTHTPPPAAPVADTAAKDREVSELRIQLAQSRMETIKAKADGWYDALFAANRIVPAERADAVNLYVRASVDDIANPVAEGKSRVETLDAIYKARTPHTLTKEQLGTVGSPDPAKVPAGHQSVAPGSAGENAPVSEARVAELMGHLVAACVVGPDVLAK